MKFLLEGNQFHGENIAVMIETLEECCKMKWESHNTPLGKGNI